MKAIGPRTTVHELITAYPFLIEGLAAAYPTFAPLENPALRPLMARMATLERAAGMAKMPVQQLLQEIAKMIAQKTGQSVDVLGAETPEERAGKVAALKSIIEKLHAGMPLDEARREFEAVAGSATPEEIAEMEQALIRGGMPVEEIQRLCDVHVNVFRTSLDDQSILELPSGHPAHTYMAENREIEKVANRWVDLCRRNETSNPPPPQEGLAILDDLAKVEVHYARKENQLFPAMERHQFTGPSKVMWSLHDEIRKRIKDLRARLEAGRWDQVATEGLELARQISEMIYKEEKILLPTAMSLLSEEEWGRIRAGDDAIGYVFVKPGSDWAPTVSARTPAQAGDASAGVSLDTGSLTVAQLRRILVSLPVEISFVDDQDTVRFYSDHPHRIFPRSPEVIGRKVQNCHPQKSVHKVTAILKAFREGTRDEAQFWIQFKGRFVVISYYPVRSPEGTYLGCLEVTQDATNLRNLQGEQRLLDWE